MKTALNVIGCLSIVGGMFGAIEFGAVSFISGIVSGVLFLAAAKVIELLERTADAVEKIALQRRGENSAALNPQGTTPASLYGRGK